MKKRDPNRRHLRSGCPNCGKPPASHSQPHDTKRVNRRQSALPAGGKPVDKPVDPPGTGRWSRGWPCRRGSEAVHGWGSMHRGATGYQQVFPRRLWTDVGPGHPSPHVESILRNRPRGPLFRAICNGGRAIDASTPTAAQAHRFVDDRANRPRLPDPSGFKDRQGFPRRSSRSVRGCRNPDVLRGSARPGRLGSKAGFDARYAAIMA